MAQYKVADLIYPLNEQEGYAPGDQAAHRAALAMADRFDAPTIIALTDAMRYLTMRGGQLEMATLRERIGADGEPVGRDEPGEYITLGLTIFYETRDAKLARIKPITEVRGIAVEDFDRPPTEYQDPEPGPPDEELEQLPEPAEPVAATG